MRHSGTYSRAALATRRFRFIPRSAWLGARARNALSRPWRLIGVGLVIFVVVLTGYLLLPAGVRGVMTMVRAPRVERRDTTILIQSERVRRASLDAAEASLARLRSIDASLLAPHTPVALSAEEALRRDSLRAVASSLSELLRRADNAPLPESFRGVASLSVLRDDARIRALADTLADVERERDALGAGATVDPVFVALTTQLNEIGRRITAIGDERLAQLRQAIQSLESPHERGAADAGLRALPDSEPLLDARREAQQAYEEARRALQAARAENAAADSVAARARARSQLAPLPILVLGAATIAAFLAFGLAMFDEMRSPRVADVVEAERLTGLRVLAVARLREVPPERSRRAADQQVPALLDPTYDGYRVLAWHLTSQWPRDGIVTVTGDESIVVATVAANLAAILANDARTTLLIDADLAAEPVRTVLALPQTPGLAAVVENRRKWSEALVGVIVGRGRSIDVLPGGGRQSALGPAESQVLVDEVRRAARRHDATIVVTSLAGVKRFRAGDDVVVCATQSKTRLFTLERTVATLVDEGTRVRGVVLWEGPLPASVSDNVGADAA